MLPTLRFKADDRALAYLVCNYALVWLLWNTGFNAFGYFMLLFFSMTMAVVAHNTSHQGMFEEKWANKVMDYLVSGAYGNPIFAWTPTHAQNHHIFANREGDEAISWRWTNRNTWWMALLYYPMCVYYQTKLVNPYLARLWKTRRKDFFVTISEHVVFYGYMAVLFYIDWRKAILFALIPQQFSLWCVHFFNYVQHVDCDLDSKWNHSRNFTGRWLNAFLFNNGYHFVHHWKPMAHWSELEDLHAQVQHLIHPELQFKNVWSHLIRQYVIGALVENPSPDFTGHIGSVERQKAPPVPETWSGYTSRFPGDTLPRVVGAPLPVVRRIEPTKSGPARAA